VLQCVASVLQSVANIFGASSYSRRSMLQCVAVFTVCCSVLQCVAVCCSVLQCLQCVAACCSVLQCLQCVEAWPTFSAPLRTLNVVCCALYCSVLPCSVLQCVAVCCSVLQCVAVCCSVSQCFTMCCNERSKTKTQRVRPKSRVIRILSFVFSHL